MLTPEQRAELEAYGPEVVQAKLMHAGPGRGAAVLGFDTAKLGLNRGDVEDWLAEKHVVESRERKSTLRWAKIAGWAAIAGVLIGILTVAGTIWLAK